MSEKIDELVQNILSESLSKTEERAAIDMLERKGHPGVFSLLRFSLEQKHRYKEAFESIKREHEESQEKLKWTPWLSATFLEFVCETKDRALVATGNGRVAVLVDEQVDSSELRRGRPVFLSYDRRFLIALARPSKQVGSTGILSRLDNGRAVIRGRAEEKIVVDLAEDLGETRLKEGDHLLYDAEALVAFEQVEKGDESAWLLEEIPDVSFDRIGGLDGEIAEITREIELHYSHPRLVAQHELRPIQGITLTGPPGVGKTMLAKGVANYLAGLLETQVRFVNLKAGAHRSMWFGQTEENIGRIFSLIKQLSKDAFVVGLFDDFDQLGSRSDHASDTVDTRVLPRFLHELDGLNGSDRVLLFAATNRPDLLDEALLRPGRFGDRVYRIPRPNREMAGEILQKHLSGGLPLLGVNGKSPEGLAEEIIQVAVSSLYAPNGECAKLGSLTFRDGSKSPLMASQLMSGAILANAVSEAKRQSCFRAIEGGCVGICAADLLRAIDRELQGIAARLKPGASLRHLLGLSEDRDVVKIDLTPNGKDPKSYEYVSSVI